MCVSRAYTHTKQAPNTTLTHHTTNTHYQYIQTAPTNQHLLTPLTTHLTLYSAYILCIHMYIHTKTHSIPYNIQPIHTTNTNGQTSKTNLHIYQTHHIQFCPYMPFVLFISFCIIVSTKSVLTLYMLCIDHVTPYTPSKQPNRQKVPPTSHPP